MRHTRGYRTSRPATYFALHRKGFVLPPSLLPARWALTPPFHPYPYPREQSASRSSPRGSGRYILCDTIRQSALKRSARTCGEARAASCPTVSGLSSPLIKERWSDDPAPKPTANLRSRNDQCPVTNIQFQKRPPPVLRHWSLVIGHWSLVIGHWSLVIGHWSLVIGHWSLVIGHWSLVIGHSA